MVSNGRITAAGVAALRERFSFTDLSSLKSGLSIEELTNNMLTVRLIVDYVEHKLKATSAA
jgi:hypothetical protein